MDGRESCTRALRLHVTPRDSRCVARTKMAARHTTLQIVIDKVYTSTARTHTAVTVIHKAVLRHVYGMTTSVRSLSFLIFLITYTITLKTFRNSS